MAIAGIAHGYEVDLDPYLTERGKQVFAKAETSCIAPQFLDELLNQRGVTWDDLVLPEYRDLRDFDLLQELGGRDYCERGVTVDYAGYPQLSHVLSAPVFMAEAAPWIDARFAGLPAPVNCGTY